MLLSVISPPFSSVNTQISEEVVSFQNSPVINCRQVLPVQ